MTKENITAFFPTLQMTVKVVHNMSIPENRREILKYLIIYIQERLDLGLEVNLTFVCTHNSRRSQFSQVWAQAAANFYGVKVNSFSGGVEVTTFNNSAITTLKNNGFDINLSGINNPKCEVLMSHDLEPLIMFSKFFNDPINPVNNFASVMTCSHADENCPVIPGSQKRFSIPYQDPKMFDGLRIAPTKYHECSIQVASEMFYIFSKLKNK
jgi:arsenate reductase